MRPCVSPQLLELFASYCTENAWRDVERSIVREGSGGGGEETAVNWVMALKSARWLPDVVAKMDEMAKRYSLAAAARSADGRVCGGAF